MQQTQYLVSPKQIISKPTSKANLGNGFTIELISLYFRQTSWVENSFRK